MLRDQLAAEKRKSQSMEMQNRQLREELVEHKATASQHLAKAIEALDKDRARLQQEIHFLSEQNALMRTAREAAEERAETKAKELRDTAQGLRKAEDDLEKSEKARRLQAAKLRQAEEAKDALVDEKKQIKANAQRLEANMAALSSEFNTMKQELDSVTQQCDVKIAAVTSRLTAENEELKENLNSASQKLTICEDSLAVATKDLTAQLGLVSMLRQDLGALKASSMAEKEELQLALKESTREALEYQTQLDEAETQVTRMSQDEQVLQRSLESALQSATEMQNAPEDVSAEVRHGAWVGLYRSVGRILDSKFPLGGGK